MKDKVCRWLKKGYRTFFIFALIIVCGLKTYQYKYTSDKESIDLRSGATFQSALDTLDENIVEKPADQLKLYARSAVLIDGDSGRILFEKDGFDVMPMASTTKIMTCMIALEYGECHPLDKEWVTVSSYAASQPKVKAGLKKGEEYLLSDLLYSMMLESHNDTAVAVAEHIGRMLLQGQEAECAEDSKKYVKAFTDRMDEKAKELGCVHTNFVTPNGLDAEDEAGQHATSAVELGKIAAYAMKEELFCRIIQTSNYAFSDKECSHTIHVYNKDAYLTMEDGACGVKTGFTNKAGYCFVGARKNADNLFISVVLGCGWPPEKSKKWSDTRKIMAWGVQNYEKKKITYHPFEQYLCVSGGTGEYCRVAAEIQEEQELLMAPWEKVTAVQYLEGTLKAPVREGDIVGYQIYKIDEEFLKKIPVRAQQSISVVTIVHCIEKVTKLWLL